MDYAATIGDIVINRAYNNWQYYSRYRDALLVHAIDLIQLFPKGANAKNGADIRLALDALQDVQNHPNVTHVVIVGGDSDFISLAQKLRQNGRSVIGIGVQGSTNRYGHRAAQNLSIMRRLPPRLKRRTRQSRNPRIQILRHKTSRLHNNSL